MRVILSINPAFAQRIYAGTKLWEVRRKIWSCPDIEEGIIYTTKPIGLLTGTFKIGRILHLSLKMLLLRTGGGAGASVESFDKLFSSLAMGYAIELLDVCHLQKYVPLLSLGIPSPPQGWRYVSSCYKF
jgi:predicted transcriptional regulator